MKTKKHDTQWMVSVALMAAIVILLANTPLGMIQLPIIKATTVHIPVIIGAILLGPSAGAILGFVFGVCSLVSNTMAPTLLSFAFSPFMSTTGIPGAIKAIWISVYTIQLVEGAEEFDTHAYAKAEFKSGPQFESKLKFYQSKYLSRLNDAAQA